MLHIVQWVLNCVQSVIVCKSTSNRKLTSIGIECHSELLSSLCLTVSLLRFSRDHTTKEQWVLKIGWSLLSIHTASHFALSDGVGSRASATVMSVKAAKILFPTTMVRAERCLRKKSNWKGKWWMSVRRSLKNGRIDRCAWQRSSNYNLYLYGLLKIQFRLQWQSWTPPNLC